MAYLYMNYLRNLTGGSTNWDDYFTESLTEQYEALKPKLEYSAAATLQQFVEMVMPTGVEMTCYVSMPGFDRQLTEVIRGKNGRPGKNGLRNVVVRPLLSGWQRFGIPTRYDLIVIGDIVFDSVANLTVKGIDLIDAASPKFGERQIRCTAANAFTEKTIAPRGSMPFNVADYRVSDMKSPVLTQDFALALCQNWYPVPDTAKEKVCLQLEEWDSYVRFRRYYLGKLSERCEAVTSVQACDSYMLTREAYRAREAQYAPMILDGDERFSKGEQVVLAREVAGADAFPLIRVEIEKKRKDALMGRGQKRGGTYEAMLRRYSNESVGLSPTRPQYDEHGNQKNFTQYALGERYLFSHEDILPDFAALEEEYRKKSAETDRRIGAKYASIINAELRPFLDQKEKELEEENRRELETFRRQLELTLERDAEENGDREIRKKYDEERAKRQKPADEAFRKTEKELKGKIAEALKEKGGEKKAAALRSQLLEAEERHQKEAAAAAAGVSLKALYAERNEKRAEQKEKTLRVNAQRKLEEARRERLSELELQHKEEKERELEAAHGELERELAEEKERRTEEETVRRYRIYFRPADPKDKAKDAEEDLRKNGAKFLTFDNRAEKAKLDRQEKALSSVGQGFVRNPYLPSYLFAPETLPPRQEASRPEPDWYLDGLNEEQKLAVRRALDSDSLFLLQGPPGTGKTQVIAEITAQLCKQGKKVLISSETHKAIDNVFERLPKIPEIRPLRLIPSSASKETAYGPERLTDNFYANIAGTLKRRIERFEHFEETKGRFQEMMRTLRLDYGILQGRKQEADRKQAEADASSRKLNSLRDSVRELQERQREVREQTDGFRRTVRNIETYTLEKEGTQGDYIEEYRKRLEALLSEYPCLKGIPAERVRELASADLKALQKELAGMDSEQEAADLERRRQQLRRRMGELRDPDTDEAPQAGEPGYEEFKACQKELIGIRSRQKELENSRNAESMSDSMVFTLFGAIADDEALLKKLPEQLSDFRLRLRDVAGEMRDETESGMAGWLSQDAELEERIRKLRGEIAEEQTRYEALSADDSLKDYAQKHAELRQRITKFFRDFDIPGEYDPNDIGTAFPIIEKEWAKLEKEYAASAAEKGKSLKMYRSVCGYLSNPDILEDDRREYTSALYGCANVFGITCTSRDKFTKSQLAELGRYGIKDIDIRRQGIDVVIVDEVSKSSFLDLLIPILYGKTVILVGDHRQLPPMYDLRFLRKDDFEGLDENIITPQRNEGYRRLYEECFFKSLYERVPEQYRVMLKKQYRCHSDIMEVFNHFYGGPGRGLTVGKKSLNDEKEHGLTVRIGGKAVIEPKVHVCFVDCDGKESSSFEGSTSKINEQEAEVAIKLLKKLDGSCAELMKKGRIRHSEKDGIDERPSAGVICTYGDQARLINRKRKNHFFSGFSQKQDERLIISTVDDFQGDERDIIIVSMVRNPQRNRGYNAEFITQFERINVALSRARKLLIIVGSRSFLTEAGVIDLPDLEGRPERDQRNFHVYGEIINTVISRGRLLTAADILGEEDGKQ